MCVPNVAKVRRRVSQARQVLIGVVELAVFQRQGFDQIKRHAGTHDEGAFVAPFVPLGLGLGTRGDAAANAAGSHRGRSALRGGAQHHGANGHVKGGCHLTHAIRAWRSCGPHDPHRPAVHTTWCTLQRTDHLHRAHLGCTGDGTTREQRSEHIAQRGAGPCAGSHVRRHLPHRGQSLRGKQCGNAHAVRHGDAREVAAQQVHDHHVLRALLGGCAQVVGVGCILRRRGAARGSAFHGARKNRAAVGRVHPVKKKLGRNRQHLLGARIDVRTVPTRLRALQCRKQCIGTAVQRAMQRRGVIDLVQLTRANGLLDAGQRSVEIRAGQAVVPGNLRAPRVCVTVVRHTPWPCQRCVIHRKPSQRAIGRLGLHSGIKRSSGLITNIPHTPVAALGASMHRVDHAAHLRQRRRHQHLPGRAKRVAQARRTGMQRLREVDAGCHGQSRLWGVVKKRSERTHVVTALNYEMTNAEARCGAPSAWVKTPTLRASS